ncbi:MAG TPA: cbb3-type cytochrome c oxidase subunit 3 [Chitinophagaceae bacterium]|jgi:cbb3-type cytochrome oxidase subunit 3|nr:cbb3-type cytochrome c oxidase subunit 3 [Chitinophagaceae bacterium]HMU58770.1 cbb3-type cytochrome c oxidase subunit 3 [Chitinophagaceae bacterium]
MKFIHYLEKVSGVSILGLVSLLIFFLFFVVMLTWVFKTKKSDFDEVSKIPLDNQNSTNQ